MCLLIYYFVYNILLQSQRQFKSADAERTEAQDKVNDLQSQKNSLTASKRKADQQLSSLQDEYEETETESKENAEKLRKALEQVQYIINV